MESQQANILVINQQRGAGCLVQFLWFIAIGWLVGQIWMVAAYLLMLTIIGMPLGIRMINSVPYVIALRETPKQLQVATVGNITYVSDTRPQQRHWLVRTIYFLILGFWITAVWLELAYLFTYSIIFMPLGLWMFDRAPGILTLRRRA